MTHLSSLILFWFLHLYYGYDLELTRSCE